MWRYYDVVAEIHRPEETELSKDAPAIVKSRRPAHDASGPEYR